MKARSMFRLLSRIKLQLLLAVALAIPPIAMAGTASAEPDSSGTFSGTLLASCEYKSDIENGDVTASCPDAISIGANELNAFAGVLKFDLSGFDGTVLEADLKLYVTANNADEEASPELTIYQHDGNWTEPTTLEAAWPSYGSGLHARAVAVTEKDGAWMTFNIASLVRDSINKGQTELVLVLANMRWDAGGQRIFQFTSSGTNSPQLDISYTTSPVQLPAPHARIAAGDGFTLSLQDDGTVKAYGWINGSKIEVPDNLTGVQSVYASNACGYAIKTDGSVAALGDGCTVPAEVPNSNVVGLVLDGSAPAVLKNDGTIINWGSGQYKMPEEWETIYGPFKSVTGGYNHAAALTWDGDVVSWGSASMGATSVPEDLPETAAIASGINHTLGLLKDGSVRLWGYWSLERPPADLPKAVAIGANDNYSVVVTRDGAVVVWGDGERLQPPAGLSGVVAVAAGRSHIVALKSDGTLVGWGNNQHGETVTPAPSVKGLSWSAGSEIGTTKAIIADESLNDENYGELTLKYRIGAAGSVRHPYVGEDPADLGYDTELHAGDELTVPAGQHVYVMAEYEEKDEEDSAAVGVRKVAYWSDADPIVAKAPPEAPSVTADDAANTIAGLTTAMEFQVDDGAYVRYVGTNAPDLSGTHTVKVRVAADPATGTPAGAAATLSFTTNPPAPAAPSVSADDAVNTIAGLTTAMEFQVDDGTYVKYNGTNAPDLTGTHTVKVRVAADPATGTPAGAAATLSFTTNPPAPAAPSVTADDAANAIAGLTTAMEFQIDGGAYVKYDGTNAPVLSGTHTVKVRVAADLATGTPAGAAATLSFTTNPPAPEAPIVSADDAANTIIGLTTAMEFQVDGGAYVKYDGTNAPDLSGTRMVKVRVAADPATGTPAGAAATLSFTTNPPAPEAPIVSADDAVNTIAGLTTAMEFQVDDGTYVKYNGTNAPDLTGTHTVKVRVAADPATGTPAGAAATLSFTTPSTYVPPTSTPSAPKSQGVDVLVNGKAENIGAATTSTRSNQTVTTVIVDERMLEQKLAAEGQKAVLTIPVNKKSDVVVGELSGRMIQGMEQKQAIIEIKTDHATYTIPTRQINISAISEQLGKTIGLQDITIQIEVAAPNEDTVKRVESSAKNGDFSIIVPPVEFTIRAVSGDQTIELTRFEAYVERTIAIPDGVDPSKITTGIVVEPDGTVRHVPTQIVMIGTQYFAKINSLTNSTYSLVYNPVAFDDVDRHWAKTEVNDMGSRMVVNGTGNGLFNPDQAITRAEFAAIMVRGLGLKLAEGATAFSDVKPTDWFGGAIQTLYQYKLIDGFEDGTFRPADTITREQAMKIMAQAMVLTDLESKLSLEGSAEPLKPFADGNTTAEWAKAGVADVIQAGIIKGRSGSTLAPKANITRAEVAVMIRKLLQSSGLI
ncbi:Alpha-tubulin suppressor [Cohnella sp. OV330]|uniref:S-layer homology domain-containing protein n=1 Tax=Cohnella sp. OV330 TaxID=1855288 RepID=UPI0008ECF64C|nr:S-layer homology domain-containing protein [Cohnella sp. OV330]SFB02969.1 Alpha-tubulin suppressor [Cohnella sp. OV330]